MTEERKIVITSIELSFENVLRLTAKFFFASVLFSLALGIIGGLAWFALFG